MKKLSLLLILSLVLFSCKKEGPQGLQGPQGAAGPEAKTFNFNLTFNPGDTFGVYSGITGFDQDDMVITYVFNDVYGGNNYYVQTPYTIGNFYFWTEVNESSGNLFVNVTKADGSSGSPFTTTKTLAFKAVLIKSSALILNPDVDFSNYDEVVKTFNITE